MMKTVRWKIKKVLCVAILLIFLILLIYIAITINALVEELHCSDDETKEFFNTMCQKYNAKEVDGNMCEDLCHSRKIQYNHCINYRRGKKVVIIDCKGACIADSTVRAVLKSEHDWDKIKFIHLDNSDQKMFLPQHTVREAEQMINESVFSDLGIALGKNEVFSRVWFSNLDDFLQKSRYPGADRAAIMSIWALIQQDEYIFMKLHQHLPFIPQLYGSCGSFFLMEYTPPGNILNPKILHTDNSTWTQRAKIALGLLDVIHSLETGGRKHLHFCDIKEENFGINEKGFVKIIDTDTLFYEDKLLSILGGENCTSDKHCDFWDCHGMCEQKTGKCLQRRTNNNLQSVCEKIFSKSFTRLSSGLLRNPPKNIQMELEVVLNKCTYSQYYTRKMSDFGRVPTGKDIYWKLYHLLQKSIDGRQF